ncbi:MAG: HAD-IA family hydrolase [Thomasclavelia sp.]|nr:HAD-IA family hydrolase [Thomasclavelia sp.]
MIDTIIFDLDGTLVDSLEDLANTTNILLKKYSYPTHKLDEYRYFVGNGVNKLLENAFKPNKIDIQKIRSEFDEIYLEHCLDNTKPYKGILECVNEFYNQGYKLSIVTNKPSAMASKIGKTLFKDKFAYIFGNTSYQPRKPDPTLTNLAINLMESKKKNVVYIGDSDVDVQTAINTKVKCIGCDWGFRGKDELIKAGCDAVATHPSDIKEIINDWNK